VEEPLLYLDDWSCLTKGCYSRTSMALDKFTNNNVSTIQGKTSLVLLFPVPKLCDEDLRQNLCTTRSI
jgi:hypothetical protein